MNPDDPASQFNWAVTALKSKKLKPALKAISRVTQLTPKDAVAWEIKGQIELALSDDKAAAESLEKSVSLDSHRAEADYQLAKLYTAKGDAERGRKALQAYAGAAKGQPDMQRRINLGVLWNKLGDDKQRPGLL